MNLTLSVIIPTKDRFDDIQVCLDSILKQTILQGTFIVVDASNKNEKALNATMEQRRAFKQRIIENSSLDKHEKNLYKLLKYYDEFHE